MRERNPISKEDLTKKTYQDPYEQDLQNFPESFKIFDRNHKMYEEVDKRFKESPNEEIEITDRSFKEGTRDPWNRKF